MKKLLFPFVLFISQWIDAQMVVTQPITGAPLPGTATNAIHAWYRGGNTNVPTANNVFGTSWNSEVHHITNNIWRWSSTTNNGLNNSLFNSIIPLNGDGISIRNNGIFSGSFASIDLFTSNSNSTAIRMGRGFLMQTANNRTEHISNYNGFWYNATNVWGPSYIPQYIWNINQQEQGRLNHFGRWRFGPNPTNLQPNNRVEIRSATGDPYFPSASGLRFTGLTSGSPTIANGVNGVNSNKVLTVDVNGDVVLTNPISVSSAANNGLQVTGGFVQLGGNCFVPSEVFNARLQTDRKVDLRNRFLIFQQQSPVNGLQPGRVGFGDFTNCPNPGNLVEIVKNRTAPNGFGLSGLRLTDLRFGTTVNPPNGQALSVDANGDVILVTATSGGNVNWCGPVPPNNVVKAIGGNLICETNITDMFPLGFVGINQTAPNDGLDVSPPAAGGPGTGDIDVTSPINRYEINDLPVLWHKGNINDVFVGVGAAANAIISNNNTIMGHDASSAAGNIGVQHTMIGAEAGANHQFGMDYTFVGYRAGWGHPGGLYTNTFIGSRAGEFEQGAENVYVGVAAGLNPSASLSFHNTFVGNSSGSNVSTGNSNTFLGFITGSNNTTGSQNVAIGDFADFGANGLNNAIAIGSTSLVMNNNNMILGNNSVNVGIGLSGVAGGPGNKLEINTPALTPIPGASGLRFTDLNNTSSIVANPGPGVLSVDPNGDVIYVQGSSGGGGGSLNFCTTFPPPPNNVVKATSTPNEVCQTNITDIHPLGGVGINNTAPNDALDVANGIGSTGDIDINTLTSAYQINDQDFLWHKGVIDNLYVGVNAGLATPTGGGVGIGNVIMGHNAASGAPLSVGQNDNVIIGNGAAANMTFGTDKNVYIGARAGRTADGVNNVYVGYEAGENNAPGADENVIVGWRAGHNNSGLHNVFVGNLSGMNNNGFQNTFVGIGSGMNGGGVYNVSLGGGSGPINNTISNSGSIGNGVNARNSNQMLIGDLGVNVGIGLNTDITGPQNNLEIDAGLNGTLPSTAGPGASGLRFRDLKSNATTIPNPGPGVLSVDPNGDVIYVPAPTGGGSGVGSYCGTPPNPLTGNYDVPLNGNDYTFSDDAVNSNRVGVGYNCLGGLPGKLNAYTNFLTNTSNTGYAVHGLNTNTTALSVNNGVYGESNNPGLSTDAYGVHGKATASSRLNYGVYGEAGSNPFSKTVGGRFESLQIGNSTNIGVSGEADNGNGFGVNIGVEGIAHPATYSYGGIFDAISLTNNFECIGVTGRGFPFGSAAIPTYPFSSRIGVYGQAQNVAGSGDYAGFFDGNLWVNGVANGIGYVLTSDRKFKTNIESLSNGLEIIKKLKPRTYLYDMNNKWGMLFDDEKQHGFIAQELEEVLPELVKEEKKPAMYDKEGKKVLDEVEFKGVNYDGLISILVKSVQELEEQNAKQSKLIEELTEKVNTMGIPQQKQETTLGNGNVIVLDQNVPNPFQDKTVIGYNIPQHAGTAYIYFYSNDGKLIQQTLLTQKGKGEITVYANNLSTGNYTYSLVIDGKVLESRKMTIR